MEAFNKVQPKKINVSDYEMQRTLGSGSFGRVKLAKNKKDGNYVAIKILKKSELIKLKQVDHILNEIKILSMIDHPFLVHTDGFNQDKKFLYVVLEPIFISFIAFSSISSLISFKIFISSFIIFSFFLYLVIS